MEKVAFYACFKNQNKHSIEYFLNKISDWCLLKNYDYTVYIDKVDNRLHMNDRKELKLLKNDIESGEYSKIIVNDIKHLSRDVVETLNFLLFLEKNNCDIECVDGTDLKLYKKIIEKFNKNKEEIER